MHKDQHALTRLDTRSETSGQSIHTAARVEYWNYQVSTESKEPGVKKYYLRRLETIYKHNISPGLNVLELGCGRGDLLANLQPKKGVGVDFSEKMVEQAKLRHPELAIVNSDVHFLKLEEKFDVIILSDLIAELWDVQQVLLNIQKFCKPETRIILNTYSRLWEFPLWLFRRIKGGRNIPTRNWFAVNDVKNILQLAGFEPIRVWQEIMWPIWTPLIDFVFNVGLARIWPFTLLCLTNFVIARPKPSAANDQQSVSIVIPLRNEEGNVSQIFSRIPKMGKSTELVFVEGHSNDKTYQVIEREIRLRPDWLIQLHKQAGIGKGDAVRLGFEKATGDILMILDGDLTVPPEYLPRFYEAIVERTGEFINGVRLVYPLPKESMMPANRIGNKFFGEVFSWLLGQPVKDTLCGTKVLWKKDYQKIADNRSYFGDFDPFGDFDLLFGAAKLNLKIVDLPIRYQERTYGATNIQRWRHGLLLARMVLFAATRIKFI
jgi:SAM-dependent methyltransferase